MNARATRFPLFDSLRAIAALSVFATHAYFVLLFSNSGFVRQYATRLDVGVSIFFAISGFLLYRPWVRARLREGAEPIVRSYAWRRLLRLGPAYWVALTVTAIVLGMHDVFTIDHGPLYYGFAQVYEPATAIGGLPQAWSLCVEAAFYVFLPLYALGMRALPLHTPATRFRVEIAGVVVLYALGIAANVWALAIHAPDRFGVFPLHLTFPCYLQGFAVGMALAVLSVRYEGERLPRGLRPFDRFPGIAWAFALVAFWAVSTQIGIDGHSGEKVTDGQYLWRVVLYTAVALGIVLPAVFGDQARGLVRKLLANRALLYVGLVSYSLFLYHVTVLVELEKISFQGSKYLWVVVGLALSLIAASISYYVIERPALKLKNRVGPRTEPAPREAIAEPAPAVPARPSA